MCWHIPFLVEPLPRHRPNTPTVIHSCGLPGTQHCTRGRPGRTVGSSVVYGSAFTFEVGDADLERGYVILVGDTGPRDRAEGDRGVGVVLVEGVGVAILVVALVAGGGDCEVVGVAPGKMC